MRSAKGVKLTLGSAFRPTVSPPRLPHPCPPNPPPLFAPRLHQYTRLGKTGLEVSKICLGMMSYGSPQWADWVLDEEASLPLIKYAWDAGINFWE